MFSSRRSQWKMLPSGTMFLFCLALGSISGAQSSPSAAAPQLKSKITAAKQVPKIIHTLLAASNIPAGGAAPAVVCVLYDNVNVIEINGVVVEVHECDADTLGASGGGGAPGGGASQQQLRQAFLQTPRTASYLRNP